MTEPEEEVIKKMALIASITVTDFKAFLAEKVKVHNCPCCLANEWAIMHGEDYTLGIMALQKNGAFSVPPPNIPVTGAACNSCGYIRMHALAVVAEWKSKRDATNE